MDKQLKPKNKKIKKIFQIGIPFLGLLVITFLSLTKKKIVRIQKEDISIREVQEGDFEDVVLFNSIVEPKTSIFVNVIQGGSVSDIYVESGQYLKKGTPLLKVYNPNAELSYLTQETAIIEQINNLRNIRVSITNQQLSLDQQLISIDNDFRNASRQYKLDTILHTKGVIAENDYKKSKQEFNFQKERNNVIKKKVSEEKKSRETQLAGINTSIFNMQKSLELLRKNKENFTVKAPADGLLSSFNPILGQTYNQGESVGKIDVLDGYKLVAKVDEYYISKLKEGLKGNVAIDNEIYTIELAKIYPEITNGQFTVELFFENKPPSDNIKRGMSLKSKVFLSGNSTTKLLPKGVFYQSTNGGWIYVLTTDHTAVKRTIKLGRENPFYYEILEGLEIGEKVITSGYDGFKEAEELSIQ